MNRIRIAALVATTTLAMNGAAMAHVSPSKPPRRPLGVITKP